MTLAERRAAKAHAFVEGVGAPALRADDRHHFEHVLRLRPGEEVTVSDGAGAWRRCTWGGGADVEPLADVEHEPAPAPRLVVGFALTKGQRPEWVVQKLTEVGVDRIVPFVASRSVVRWDERKSGDHTRRWRAVARQAAMQSRRVWLPVVDDVQPFAEVAAAWVESAAVAEPGGVPPSLAHPVVLVGPEGGWDAAELGCGLPTIGLGPTLLRAETAAVAAGVLMAGLRAGVVAATIPDVERPTL